MRGGVRSTSWKPGASANPGGKPKKPATIEVRKVITDVNALAKEMAPDAIKTLVDVMKNPKSPAAARVSAATAILDRGYGKPTQAIAGPDGEGPVEVKQITDHDRVMALAAFLAKTKALGM